LSLEWLSFVVEFIWLWRDLHYGGITPVLVTVITYCRVRLPSRWAVVRVGHDCLRTKQTNQYSIPSIRNLTILVISLGCQSHSLCPCTSTINIPHAATQAIFTIEVFATIKPHVFNMPNRISSQITKYSGVLSQNSRAKSAARSKSMYIGLQIRGRDSIWRKKQCNEFPENVLFCRSVLCHYYISNNI
jgi:hypothetical protein